MQTEQQTDDHPVSDAAVLARLVRTARSARLDHSFFKQLNDQIMRAPAPRVTLGAGNGIISRFLARMGTARTQWHAHSLALSLSCVPILIGFILVGTLVQPSGGRHTRGITPAARAVYVAQPAQTVPVPLTASTDIPNQAGARVKPGLTVTAAAAPTPPSHTPAPSPARGDSLTGQSIIH
ncbi:MAG: hypothetical protein M1546_27800 [Chloroflexi bacterium]|nr:hypothetical protein [Chloroflexota bacterium]